MAASQLLLAFYGDDFTGSTDALDFLNKAGIKTMLFIEPPSAAQLARYPGLQAIGIAGKTRAMAPDGMEETLGVAFEALKALNIPHVHYKVCSTFDSSPAIGSIGRAIDTGAAIFNNRFIPLLVAAPALGRYCVFGNLFAVMGIGSNGDIYRLDRHPSMSRHPVTPADESDLRLHLSRQTDKRIGLMNILDIALPDAEMHQQLDSLVTQGCEVVLFDALYEAQLERIGELLDKAAQTGTLFSVGSSGIEMALGNYWNKQAGAKTAHVWQPAGYAGPLLVLSGSCSPVTAKQITYALNNGFAEAAVDTQALVVTGITSEFIVNEAQKIIALIHSGKSVIVHTSHGDNDPRVAQIQEYSRQNGVPTAAFLGTLLGHIAVAVAAAGGLKRILVAGGDTAGFVARAMGIEAVEIIAPLAPGAPLCKVYAPGSAVDGLEINFKGGQVGSENYLLTVLQGNSL